LTQEILHPEPREKVGLDPAALSRSPAAPHGWIRCRVPLPTALSADRDPQPGCAVQCHLANPTPLPFGCRLPAATPLPFGCTAAGARRPALRRAELCRPAGGVCLSPPRGCSRAELGSINDRGQRRTRLPSKRAQHRQRYARSKTTSCSHHISVSTALPATTLWCSRRLPSPQ